MRIRLAFLFSIFAISSCDCGGDEQPPPPGADVYFSDVVFEVCGNDEDDDSNGLTDCEDPQCHTSEACRFEPVDPSTLAPDPSPETASSFWQSVRFLVEGSNPVVREVKVDRLKTSMVSVVRARILDRQGEPLSGVRASIAGRPEFGYTFSREDGFVDFIVNAETRVVIRFDDTTIVPVDVDFEAPPLNDFAVGRDVVATRLDSVTTRVTSDSAVFSESSVVLDEDGERAMRVFFNKGTKANAVLKDQRRARLESFTLRATEYTVGDSGPDAMPGLLPPTTDYTYAVELSIDELRERSVDSVEFDRPVYLYLDNFLEFPTGTLVPSGFYDRERLNSWVASENGVVIELASNGILLSDGGPASSEELSALGMTSEERQALTAAYSPGKTLWRVPVTHFTPYDLNWPTAFPDDAIPLDPSEIPDFPPRPEEVPCSEPGSTIECESQTLTKAIPIPGTNVNLWYRSDRAQGRGKSMVVTVTGPTLPQSLKRVEATLRVAGKTFTREFTAEPNQVWEFDWDGLDAYGRPVNQEVNVDVNVHYIYDVEYVIPPDDELSFGIPTSEIERIRASRVEGRRTTSFRGKLGAFDAKNIFGLGGWMLDSSVFYDGDDLTLYMPNQPHKPFVRDTSRIIETFTKWQQDEARLIGQVLQAPDGTIYIFTNGLFFSYSQVFRLEPDGNIELVAGNIDEETGFETCIFGATSCGVGGPPSGFQLLGNPSIGADNAIYFAWDTCIRRFDPKAMTYENWAGKCEQDDESFEIFPRFDRISACGDSIYVTTNQESIWRFRGPSERAELVAGFDVASSIPDYNADTVDGADAIETSLGELIDPACAGGNLFWIDQTGSILQLKDGKLDVYWANINQGVDSPNPLFLSNAQSGGPYVRAQLGFSRVLLKAEEDQLLPIAGARLEEVYALPQEEQERRLNADGVIATDAAFTALYAATELLNGDILILDQDEDAADALVGNRFRLIKDALPTFDGSGARIIDPTGSRILAFDPTGRFLSSTDSRTTDLQFETTLNTDGYVEFIRRFDGLETQIERDADGEITAIIGFFGLRTEIDLDDDGYISKVTFPDGATFEFTYDDGLLTTYKHPTGETSTYTYDPSGGMNRADLADGAWKTFERSGDSVVMTTSSGRIATFGKSNSVSGKSVQDEAGLTSTRIKQGNIEETTHPDGTLISVEMQDDPRFGSQAKYTSSLNIQLPSGLVQRIETARDVELSDSANLLSVVEAIDSMSKNGNTWTRRYSHANRTMTSTSPEGRVRTSILDELGRVTGIQVGGFTPLELTWENGSLATAKMGEYEVEATYTNGLLSSVSGTSGPSLTFARDARGDVIRKQKGDVTWNYGRDELGLPTAISTTEPWMSFDWDVFGRLEKHRFQDGAEATFSYSETGQLETATQAGQPTVTFEYDEAQRVVRAADAQRVKTWVYDPATGHLLESNTPEVALAFTYDGTLRTRTEVGFNGETMTISKSYSADFAVESWTLDGKEFLNTYDRDELLTEVDSVKISYHSEAPIIESMELGAVRLDYELDSYGRITTSTWTGPNGFSFEESITLDANSSVTSHRIGNVTTDYGYDDNTQLVSVSRLGTGLESFDYDDAGNMVSGPFGAQIYDTSGRLQSVGGTPYAFDDAGRITTKGTTQFVFDGFNDLIEVDSPNGEISYAYDAAGNRVGRTKDNVATDLWIYDNGYRPIAHKDLVSNQVTHFIYAQHQHVPSLMVRGDSRYALVTDYLGSVRHVVNTATGFVEQSLDYDVWGNIVSDTSPGFQPFGFAGGMIDLDTGMLRMGVRDYDPMSGRFISIDPSGLAGGENFWMYTANNPTSRIDPNGEFWVLVGGGAIVIAGGAYLLNVANTAFSSAEPSLTISNELGSHNGPGDALRHCTMNCRLVRRHGQTIAQLASDYHEAPFIPRSAHGGGSKNTSDNPERLMDEFNNACGQRVAREQPTNKSCLRGCEEALLNGELRTLDSSRWNGNSSNGDQMFEDWKNAGPRSAWGNERY